MEQTCDGEHQFCSHEAAEAAARSLLDEWLRSQNAQDWAAYEALFDERFAGVKRSGPRLYSFDRAGWMADRKKMFRRPFTVTVDAVAVSVLSGSAVIDFEQTWSSRRYRDSGPKRLVLSQHGAEYRIAREDMLRSNVALAATSPTRTLYPILEANGAAVLLTDAAEIEWRHGPLRLFQGRSAPYMVEAQVRHGLLPARLRASLGRNVFVLDGEGNRCELRLPEPLLLARMDPHFGTLQYWQGDPEVSDAGPVPEREIAEEVLGAEGLLIARLPVEIGACREPFAVATSPNAAVWSETEPEAAALELIFQAFRGSDIYRQLRDYYVAEDRDMALGFWTDLHHDQVRTFAAPGSDARLWILQAREQHQEDCSVGTVVHRRVFYSASRSSPEQVYEDSCSIDCEVLGVADGDGDGAPEIVTQQSVVGPQGTGWTVLMSYPVPSFDCPC